MRHHPETLTKHQTLTACSKCVDAAKSNYASLRTHLLYKKADTLKDGKMVDTDGNMNSCNNTQI